MAETATLPPDIAALSFEDAMKALEEIVRKLEGGAVDLEQAVGAYERGVALKRHCESKLAEAQARIEAIAMTPDGGLTTRPLSKD